MPPLARRVADAEAKPARQARKIAETTKEVLVGRADLLGRFVAEDLVNLQTGEIYRKPARNWQKRGSLLWKRRESPASRHLPWTRQTAHGSVTPWRWTRTAIATMH